MKVKKLIELLELEDEDAEVYLYDTKTNRFVPVKDAYETLNGQILISQNGDDYDEDEE